MVRTGHDVAVIGASAGGIEALLEIVPQLPPDLPAAIFVAVHVSRDSQLPVVLGRAGKLACSHAVDGERFSSGHIYLAPPDCHMLVRQHDIRLVRGPKENRARPAVDPLFRSAAVAHGPRVVGVVLSGLLMDGAAGLRAVKLCGGLAIVQDPQDAANRGMPLRALAAVQADECLPAPKIAAALIKAVHRRPGRRVSVPAYLRTENEVLEQVETMSVKKEKAKAASVGEFTTLSCPECGGPLSRADEGKFSHFRCRIGHAFSADGLAEYMGDGLERALWAAVRQLEDHGDVLEELSKRAERGGVVKRFADRCRQARSDAQVIRKMLTTPREQHEQ